MNLLLGIIATLSTLFIDGKATYYSNSFEGKKTASGKIFRQAHLTGASNYFKIGTKVLVTNKKNGKSVTITINDRTAKSTAKRGIVVDLTTTAAKEIGIYPAGSGNVSVVEV